jgi:polyisoprenoid-binding protein YceI
MTATANATKTTSTWTVDATHAEVGFSVRHLMISTVRGRFGAVEGTVTIDEATPANSKVDITIDVTSIDTRQEMRDNHLRSADFFDVASHPTGVFRSTGITVDGTRGSVVGELTLKNVTRPVSLDVEFLGTVRDPWGGDRAVFSASATIDREEWGLTWNMLLEAGGLLVSKAIKLEIEVELVKQPA